VVKGDWIIPSGEFSAVTNVVGNGNFTWWAVPVGFILAIAICTINIVAFYFIHRIYFKSKIKHKKTFEFKPFENIGKISLTKKPEIIKMWKINWKLQ
jgi:hypothetical protein